MKQAKNSMKNVDSMQAKDYRTIIQTFKSHIAISQSRKQIEISQTKNHKMIISEVVIQVQMINQIKYLSIIVIYNINQFRQQLMAQKDLIQKLSGKPLNQSIFYNQNRLKVIKSALQLMKDINQGFLKKYQLTEPWHKINMGLMRHNIQSSLQNVVQFKLCESNKPEKTYFNPFSKKPIIMCYNKFIDQQVFNKHLDFNMILYFDSKTNKKLNWNNLEDVVLSNTRAINLSKLCQKNDEKCIRQQLQRRVFEKQRFKGKELQNLKEVIMKGLEDTTPLSQIIFKNI